MIMTLELNYLAAKVLTFSVADLAIKVLKFSKR
jgi:hypothetical protein